MYKVFFQVVSIFLLFLRCSSWNFFCFCYVLLEISSVSAMFFLKFLLFLRCSSWNLEAVSFVFHFITEFLPSRWRSFINFRILPYYFVVLPLRFCNFNMSSIDNRTDISKWFCGISSRQFYRIFLWGKLPYFKKGSHVFENDRRPIAFDYKYEHQRNPIKTGEN
jgi:hypothetical protein